MHTADGGFVGALFDSNPTRLDPWREAMTSAAESIGLERVEVGDIGDQATDAACATNGLGDGHVADLRVAVLLEQADRAGAMLVDLAGQGFL